MSFGNAYVKGAIRHTIHQHVHGAAARHGGGDSHDPFVLFRQFYQRMPEYILKQGGIPSVLATIRFPVTGSNLPGACHIVACFSAGPNPFPLMVWRCRIFGPCISLISCRIRAMFLHRVRRWDRSIGYSFLRRYSAVGLPEISGCFPILSRPSDVLH